METEGEHEGVAKTQNLGCEERKKQDTTWQEEKLPPIPARQPQEEASSRAGNAEQSLRFCLSTEGKNILTSYTKLQVAHRDTYASTNVVATYITETTRTTTTQHHLSHKSRCVAKCPKFRRHFAVISFNHHASARNLSRSMALNAGR